MPYRFGMLPDDRVNSIEFARNASRLRCRRTLGGAAEDADSTPADCVTASNTGENGRRSSSSKGPAG